MTWLRSAPPISVVALVLFGLGVFASPATAQSEGVLEIESDLQRFLLRQHALGRLPEMDAGALPLARVEASAWLDTLARRVPDASWTRVDRHLLASWRGERTGGALGERVRRRPLYPDRQSFVRVAGDGYGIEIAPLIDVSAGPAFTRRVDTLASASAAWTNTRGLRMAGHVGAVFVETRITENQQVVPLGPVEFRTAPRRAYTVVTPDVLSPGGARRGDPLYDYMTSTGVVGVRTRYFEARAGRDRNRFGFARGSLVLSNYASEYDHVQLRWSLGPLSIQSLYARFLEPRLHNDGLTESRYGAFHRVALRPGGGVELELFESVISGGRDEEGQRRGFETAYLVPFQFYRAVERDLGSPDNMLLGAGAAWRPLPGARLYAQGLLDELTAARFFEDAWTNKWAYVVGAELADPGLPGLGRLRNTDVRVEYARIRPYVYSHRDASTAAVHYGDVLGHPAGPNASDLNVRIAHRPLRDVELSADLSHTIRGRNTETQNFGSDPYAPYLDRVPEPNPTLQGVRQRIVLADVRASVRLAPHVVAGATLTGRRISDAELGRAQTVTPLAFLRWSLAEFGARY